MAAATATLAIKMTNDESDAVKGFTAVNRAADDMGDSVKRASSQAEDAGRRMAISADSADELAGKTGKATGALGALAGGLEAVGLEKYAGALQGAAIATDVASGASDALTLVMESKIVTTLKDKAATIAHTVATKAQAVATRTMTVAQKALNLAMRANPIGLLITGLLLAVGLFITAYKKSETFRNIVDGVFRAVGKVASTVAGTIRDVWNKVTDKLSGFVEGARDKIKDAFEAMKEKAQAIAGFITAPFEALVGFIDDILEKIGKVGGLLDKINPFRSVSTSAGSTFTAPTLETGFTDAQPLQVNVEFRGGFVGSEDQLARVVTTAIQRASTRTGRQVVWA